MNTTLFQKYNSVKFNEGFRLAAKRPTDAFLTKLVNNIGNRSEVEVIGFTSRCILFMFSVLDKMTSDTVLGDEMYVLISNLSGVPVLVSPRDKNALGTSLFLAIYHAVASKKQLSTVDIENDESLVLSIAGLHYTLCLAETRLREGSMQRQWVRDAREALFLSNAGLRNDMQRVYNVMAGTDIVRGNSVFAMLGVFVDTCNRDNLDETVMKYDVLIKNAYIPFIKVD